MVLADSTILIYATQPEHAKLRQWLLDNYPRFQSSAGKQRDFYKSMTTNADHKIWQDVYHAALNAGLVAYIKVTLRENGTVVIQFKEK